MAAQEIAPYNPGIPADLSALSREQLVELGRKVASVESVSRWALGDLACEFETSYGEYDPHQYAEEIGVEWSTLRGYAQVSRAFPQSVPRGTHPWSVYRVLAAQPDRLELVAREKPWTYREAERLRWDRAEKGHQRELRRAARERKKITPAGRGRKVISGTVEPDEEITGEQAATGDKAPEPVKADTTQAVTAEPAESSGSPAPEPAPWPELEKARQEARRQAADELRAKFKERWDALTAERDALAAEVAELRQANEFYRGRQAACPVHGAALALVCPACAGIAED